MNQMKLILGIISAMLVVTFIIPTVLVLPFSEKSDSEQLDETQQTEKTTWSGLEGPVDVAVFRTASNTIEKLPLEQYIIGVVAAEMPADFEKEALKAQALAARTYIVNMLAIGAKDVPEGADVKDTIDYQVYKNVVELKTIWGSDYQWKLDKITEAVVETKGQIITYEGNPITATFFSTSNGQTENSEAYWSKEVPYLRSVESPWDEASPKFEEQKIITLKEFQDKLGITLPTDGSVGKITSRTPGNQVAELQIGDKSFTGKQVRDLLELNSADFTWVQKENHIVINTKGYGHGVGMSQYGANGMAKEGKSYKEIILHYYQGVEIVSSENILTALNR
ncbi:stage II sporulation protein D [Bacillus coahuilensis m2-6]|uniref:stage II sporulation protein D n=1 Tax=Bacillus coahuilensis TaxID=408580 RepID=UPI000185148A|nr:stage II sporulation protein D [Bacillus coahuilensis]KUP05125.1 stage II sporulation protein D [Bacillus coahuilensis m2-6]